MRIVFFGTPEFAVPSLNALLAHSECTVVGVVTQPDKRRGRGNELSPSPVKTVALAHQLPVWQPKSVKKDAETLAHLQATQADVFVVVAYGQILSQQILNMPRYGCVNVHGSLLPKYRGAAPIQWSLYNGETETGITTMLMDAGMDTGAMLLTSMLPVGLLDNAQDHATKLAAMGADLLIVTLLQLVQGELLPILQDHDQATYAPLIQKADYELDWTKSAIALHNQIRGFYPNCTTLLRGQSVKITSSFPLTPETWEQVQTDAPGLGVDLDLDLTAHDRRPGEVVAIGKGEGPVIQTSSGLLLIKAAQPAGKRLQSGWDFANGTRLEVGERLGE
jgi:methionyl-tRNA formyltransferase